MSAKSTGSTSKQPSNRLNRQITQYSVAAAVAGVSMLSLVQPAVGEVIVTKKNIPIPVGTEAMPRPVKISLANNGVDNFSFALTNLPPSVARSFSFRALDMGGLSSKANPVFAGGFRTYTPPLPRGTKIGQSVVFASVGAEIENSYAYPAFREFDGYWGGNPKDHYVGVRFRIAGQTHYGWIRLTVTTTTDRHGPAMSAKITGYAYETIPNKTILAGTAATATGAAEKATAEHQVPERIQSPSGPSLGMLAAGADVLPMWRRKSPAAR